MAEGIPILCRIGLKKDARGNRIHDHPDWELIRTALGGDPEEQIIVQWSYDRVVGHDTDTAESPFGTWLGMLVVTRAFADAAKTEFPGIVTEMTEPEAETFYNTKAMAHVPSERRDKDEIQALEAERSLLVARSAPVDKLTALDQEIDKALDPDDSRPGVRRNKRKTWAGLKTDTGLTIGPGRA